MEAKLEGDVNEAKAAWLVEKDPVNKEGLWLLLRGFQGHVTHTHVVLQRCCEQEAHRYPDGDLMSQAKILEFSMWLVDKAVQQNGARYSFSSVG